MTMDIDLPRFTSQNVECYPYQIRIKIFNVLRLDNLTKEDSLIILIKFLDAIWEKMS